MSKKRKIESISFTDVDGRWMLCKVCQSEYVKVDEGIISTTCSMCVQKKCLTSMPIDDFFENMVNELIKTNAIKISNFGTLQIINKKGRIGRNPKTKVEAKISARKIVKFKPSSSLKSKLNLK